LPIRIGLDAIDDGARDETREQLLRGFVLERLDLVEALARRVVAALEHVELRELAEQRALRGMVGNLVFREHAVDVAAHRGSERLELGIVVEHVLDLAVDRVVEARQIGRFFDPLPGLRGDAAGDREREHQGEKSYEHGIASGKGQRGRAAGRAAG
jgi:hypothetical protein